MFGSWKYEDAVVDEFVFLQRITDLFILVWSAYTHLENEGLFLDNHHA